MDAEHKRPLAAFIVVTVTSALLLGRSLHSEGDSRDSARPAASHSPSGGTTPSSPSASPANGHVVEGVTASPTYLPVKSIGRTPMLTARRDDGLGVATGAVREPRRTAPTQTEDPLAGPQGAEASETPEPTPSTEPELDDAQGDGDDTPGPRGTPPRGPRSTDLPPAGPGTHTPPPTP